MAKITYRIVEHDGGWAYQVNGVFSETFPTHERAKAAAQRVAAEDRFIGHDLTIAGRGLRFALHRKTHLHLARATVHNERLRCAN